MLYSFYCVDKPGHAEVRTATRAAHLEFLDRNADRIFIGGPMMANDGHHMVGSILIVRCDDLEDAEAFAAEDPYAKAGLFESVTIRPWRQVYPKD